MHLASGSLGKTSYTYKTKLKLDKEVGGGELANLCTITYLIANPYA